MDCYDCNSEIKRKVLKKPRGWCIFLVCNCLPMKHKRESFFFGTKREAETALSTGKYKRRWP